MALPFSLMFISAIAKMTYGRRVKSFTTNAKTMGPRRSARHEKRRQSRGQRYHSGLSFDA